MIKYINWLYEKSSESFLMFVIFMFHLTTLILVGVILLSFYVYSVFLSYGLTLTLLFGGTYWYYRKYGSDDE